MSKLGALLTRLEGEFGMTPSARTRIDVKPTPEEDEFERFLREHPSTVAR